MSRGASGVPFAAAASAEAARRWLVAALAASAVALPAHAERPPPARAQLDCRAADRPYTYDCRVLLARAGAPLEGVEITLAADMPSMPMAHNVRPVKATPGTQPGEYRARLELEMHGVWAVKLRLGPPVGDLLVMRYRFDASGASPETDARR